MKITGPGKCLRVFIGEAQKWGHNPLYHAIIERAREGGLAGATVLRAISGFGAGSRVRTAHIMRLSEDLPIVIEIIDKAERIDRFLSVLDEMVSDGLITVEEIEVIKYAADKSRP